MNKKTSIKSKILLLIFIYFSSLLQAADTLVAHYQFENSINDSSGNNLHLTPPAGVAVYSADSIRGTQSYNFNGIDNYLELAIADSFPSSDNGTISFWIKSTTGADRSFVSSTGGSSGSTQIISNSNNLEIYNKEYGFPFATNEDEIDTPNIYDISWHFIAITFSSTANSEKIYIDGNLVAVDTDDTGELAIGDNLQVGGEPFVAPAPFPMHILFPGTAESRYTGLMDDLRIYSNELNASAIMLLYTGPVVAAPLVVSVPISYKTYIFFLIAILFIGLRQSKINSK